MEKWYSLRKLWTGKQSHRGRRDTARRLPNRGRPLQIEPLESRQLLDASGWIAEALAQHTPHFVPNGQDVPADIQPVILSTFTASAEIPNPDIEELEPFFEGLEQIKADIAENTEARPAYWGEQNASGGSAYRLHLADNGMLVTSWTIDWGDGSQPQTVINQPWVLHQFANASSQYAISVIAASLNGTYSLDGEGEGSLRDGMNGLESALEDWQGLNVTVQDTAPVLRVVGDQMANAGQAWTCDFATFTAPSAETEFLYWIDWGDGSEPDPGEVATDGLEWAVAVRTFGGDHAYEEAGVYFVTATVVNESGKSDTQAFQMTVLDVQVEIEDFSTDGDALIVHYTVASETEDYAAPFAFNIYSTTDGGTPETLLMSMPVEDADSLATGVHYFYMVPDLQYLDGSYLLMVATDGDSSPEDNCKLLDAGAFNSQDGTVQVFGAAAEASNITITDAAVSGTASYTLSSGISQVTIHAGDAGDTVDASSATISVIAYGGGGSDTITGGSGSDYLDGGAGNDTLSGGGGRDEIHGGDGQNTLSGGADDDVIYGEGTGSNTLHGNGGNDVIYAGEHGDAVYGDDGNDEMFGGPGVDYLYGDDNNGGPDGNDWIEGRGEGDTIRGGAGEDWLWGGDGADQISGDGDNDYLDGGAGDDTLHGGANDDELWGDGGDDVLHSDGGNDKITGGDDLNTIRSDSALDSLSVVDKGGQSDPADEYAYDGQFQIVADGPVSWQFALDSGARLGANCTSVQVQVMVSWDYLASPGTGNHWADHVAYRIYDNATLVATVPVTQSASAAHGNYDGTYQWTYLGQFTITSGNLIVVLMSNPDPNDPNDVDGLLWADAVMIHPLWPDVSIRSDADGDGDVTTRDDWLNSWNANDVPLEKTGDRVKIVLHAALDPTFANAGQWTAKLAHVAGLMFWNDPEGGDAITPDGNGNIVEATFNSSGAYDRVLYLSAIPESDVLTDSQTGNPIVVSIDLEVNGPHGADVKQSITVLHADHLGEIHQLIVDDIEVQAYGYASFYNLVDGDSFCAQKTPKPTPIQQLEQMTNDLCRRLDREPEGERLWREASEAEVAATKGTKALAVRITVVDEKPGGTDANFNPITGQVRISKDLAIGGDVGFMLSAVVMELCNAKRVKLFQDLDMKAQTDRTMTRDTYARQKELLEFEALKEHYSIIKAVTERPGNSWGTPARALPFRGEPNMSSYLDQMQQTGHTNLYRRDYDTIKKKY